MLHGIFRETDRFRSYSRNMTCFFSHLVDHIILFHLWAVRVANTLYIPNDLSPGPEQKHRQSFDESLKGIHECHFFLKLAEHWSRATVGRSEIQFLGWGSSSIVLLFSGSSQVQVMEHQLFRVAVLQLCNFYMVHPPCLDDRAHTPRFTQRYIQVSLFSGRRLNGRS